MLSCWTSAIALKCVRLWATLSAAVLASDYALRRLAIVYARSPAAYTVGNTRRCFHLNGDYYHTAVHPSPFTTASAPGIQDLLSIRDSHYLSFGRFRYTFSVKRDTGFVAPMITRGFSHFWKFPCLVLTYSCSYRSRSLSTDDPQTLFLSEFTKRHIPVINFDSSAVFF